MELYGVAAFLLLNPLAFFEILEIAAFIHLFTCLFHRIYAFCFKKNSNSTCPKKQKKGQLNFAKKQNDNIFINIC